MELIRRSLIQGTACLVLMGLTTGSLFACPACSGNLPPDEDGSSRAGSQWAYNVSIGMLLGTPAFLVGGIGYLARKQMLQLANQDPGQGPG